MLFNSFEFLWLFPAIFCVYYIVTCRKKPMAHYQKIGNYLLIAISYGLYIKWEPVYALVLLGVTAITYLAALKIERDQAYGKKKYIVFSGITLAALPLIVFKYYNFLTHSFESLLGEAGITLGMTTPKASQAGIPSNQLHIKLSPKPRRLWINTDMNIYSSQLKTNVYITFSRKHLKKSYYSVVRNFMKE